MRAFCSGLTRANTEVWTTAAISCASSRRSRSAPVSVPSTAIPRVAHTVSATIGLSPVTTLTEIPSPARRATDAAADGLGWSRKTKYPARSRSCSSAGPTEVSPLAARVATATTRLPAANSRARTVRASSVTFRQWSRTVSGAPLVMMTRSLDGSSTSTEAHRRSWSNGAMPMRRKRSTGTSAEWGESQIAASRGLPPTATCPATAASLHTSPSASTCGSSAPRDIDCPGEGDVTFGERAGLVREEHVDVAEVFDADQALDQDLALGEPS